VNKTAPGGYEEYYVGMVNYGCPEVFSWCPSGVPNTVPFYTHSANDGKIAGVARMFSGVLDSATLARSAAATYKFICESK